MNKTKQLAIIGPTASGKSQLAIDIAKHYNGIILSLDSLSVYKHIDIASAKPSIDQREEIEHYGIDILDPDQSFDVGKFAKLYREVYDICLEQNRPLIIVGGTSFYLKVLIDGISPIPKISEDKQKELGDLLLDKNSAYVHLSNIDKEYANQISPSDIYRIEKGLYIYLTTKSKPSIYFKQHPPVPTIKDKLPIYEIDIDRESLRDRIAKRTDKMIDEGLIDEVCFLEQRYGRTPSAMKAIGIREVLDYLDGIYTIEQMRDKIITNTARLAKRQVTFNRSQFGDLTKLSLEDLSKVSFF